MNYNPRLFQLKTGDAAEARRDEACRIFMCYIALYSLCAVGVSVLGKGQWGQSWIRTYVSKWTFHSHCNWLFQQHSHFYTVFLKPFSASPSQAISPMFL